MYIDIPTVHHDGWANAIEVEPIATPPKTIMSVMLLKAFGLNTA